MTTTLHERPTQAAARQADAFTINPDADALDLYNELSLLLRQVSATAAVIAIGLEGEGDRCSDEILSTTIYSLAQGAARALALASALYDATRPQEAKP